MPYSYQIRSEEEYRKAYQQSISDPETFWEDVAGNFLWRKKWNKVLEWNFREPRVKWFEGAKLNITENCIDRHLEKLGDRPAIIWEPNDPEEHHRILTYRNLYDKVCQFAH